EYLQLFVAQPYLELHTGPGRGYPVFHVVPRDASVDVLFRRTDWFKVRTEHGVEGWASQRDMLQMVLADGSPFRFGVGDRAGFNSHRYEMGLFAGAYGGANYVSGYASLSFNSQLALEAALGQFLGRLSNAATGERVAAGRERPAPCDRAGGGAAQHQGAARQELQRRGGPGLWCAVDRGFRHSSGLRDHRRLPHHRGLLLPG